MSKFSSTPFLVIPIPGLTSNFVIITPRTPDYYSGHLDSLFSSLNWSWSCSRTASTTRGVSRRRSLTWGCTACFTLRPWTWWIHWKGVHGNSLGTLAAPTCNKKGKVWHQDKSPRFKCPFEECDHAFFTTVLQLSSHYATKHTVFPWLLRALV